MLFAGLSYKSNVTQGLALVLIIGAAVMRQREVPLMWNS